MIRAGYVSYQDARFNVAVNGADVATLLPYREAQAVMDESRGKGAFLQMYRADKPLSGRKAAWRQTHALKPVTRWPALSAVEYAKSMARILAPEYAANGMAGIARHEMEQEEVAA